MNKTLLNHFTLIDSLQHETPDKVVVQYDSLPMLVRELKHVLVQAEQELLSPRPEAIEQLLKRALH